MFNSLEQRIGVGTWRNWRTLAEGRAQNVQALAQATHKLIKSLSRHGRAKRTDGAENRTALQKQEDQLPEHRSGNGETGQDIGQKNRECTSTTTPPPAIGAEDTLSAQPSAIGAIGVVAIEKTVAVERLGDGAKGTAE